MWLYILKRYETGIYIWKRGRSFDLIARTVQNKSSKSLELDRFNVKYMSWEKGKRKDESLLNCLNLILMNSYVELLYERSNNQLNTRFPAILLNFPLAIIILLGIFRCTRLKIFINCFTRIRACLPGTERAR